MVDVGDDAGGHEVKQEQGRTGEEGKNDQAQRQRDVEIGEVAHAAGDTRDRRDDETAAEDSDDYDEHGVGQRAGAADDGDALADLDGGKPQRGGGAEERGDESEDVDKLAQWAVGIAGPKGLAPGK